MTVFFDHQTFSQQLYGGVSRYFCELIRGINQTSNRARLSLLHSNNTHLREYGLNVMPYYFPKRHRLLNLTNRYYNLIDMKVSAFDVYHPTYFDPFFVKHIGVKPYVVTYHDMIHEKLGHQFASLGEDKHTITWKKAISRGATGFIAVSESTKRDMVYYLGINPDRIRVIHLSSSINVATTYAEKNTDRPYLLYVGKRDIYKNFLPFLTAVAPILKAYNLRLICAGGGAFDEVERHALKRHDVERDVEQCAITDQILVQLYSRAIAFVFPSLYEGFGIPILEAMSCHCPCLLSDRSSLPEVGGEAALYFNPDAVDDMRSTVVKLIDDSNLRKDLSSRGLERAAAFSWERTVQQTLFLYTDVAS